MISNSCHIVNYAMPCHHIFHIIIHAMSSLPLSFTEFVLPSYPWLFLCHYWTPLTSMMIHVMDPLYFIDFILLPCLLVIPLSFVNSFDINDKYILNNLPLWHWWKHLNILPLWKIWQRITCYAIEDFLSLFFLTTPPVVISPLEIALPPLQFL